MLIHIIKCEEVRIILLQQSHHAYLTSSLKIYSRLALSDAQDQYEAVIDRFPV